MVRGHLSIFIAGSFVGSIVAMSGIDNQAFTDWKKKKKINEAEQGLGQNTTTAQAATCDALGDTTASCNIVASSFNLNDSNNAAAQGPSHI